MTPSDAFLLSVEIGILHSHIVSTSVCNRGCTAHDLSLVLLVSVLSFLVPPTTFTMSSLSRLCFQEHKCQMNILYAFF
jgi:hypothetical protein